MGNIYNFTVELNPSLEATNIHDRLSKDSIACEDNADFQRPCEPLQSHRFRNLTKRREELGLTQQSLAKSTGIKQPDDCAY